MEWFGFPVEAIRAVVRGRMIEVGTVYQWADGTRRAAWHVSAAECEQGTIVREPLGQGA